MNRTLMLTMTWICMTTSWTGCTTVMPYQRGRLMQRTMQAKPTLDSAFDSHVSELRESAVGASAGGNASCGCR